MEELCVVHSVAKLSVWVRGAFGTCLTIKVKT